MSFRIFKKKVNDIIRRAGGGISVRFSKEDGRFIAKCSEGTTIICNKVSPSISVRWGDHHQAMAVI